MSGETIKKEKRPGGDASIPAYQRIAEDMRAKIRDGTLPAGTMLASRHNLAKQYGVALSTAQQAIANLIADGSLKTLDRRGTFVAHPSQSQGQPPVATTPTPPASAIPSILPPASLAVPTAAATLGIVATSLIDQAASPDVGSLWARQAIRALEEVFASTGGTTLFFDRYPAELGPYATGIDDPRAIPMADAIRALRARGADALAIVGLCDGRDVSDEIVGAVDVEKVPVVYISWHEMRPPVAQVFYDSRYAGYQAAQHLLRRGYNRLIFLAPFQESWLEERIEGARDAVRHAGLSADLLIVARADSPVPERYDENLVQGWTGTLARKAFAELGIGSGGLEAWGIIAPNDFTAYAVQRAASDMGRSAGLDYGLIGFDDDPLSTTAGLTTVRPPIEAMGQEAGRLLLRALGGEIGGLQVRLRSQIIPRASTALNVGAPVRPRVSRRGEPTGSVRSVSERTSRR